jgi:hypothetical protein
VSRNRDRTRDFASAQNFQERSVGTQHAFSFEFNQAKSFTLQFFDIAQVNHGVLDAVHILETTVRETTVERHLTAFETGTVTAAGTSLHTFVATT